jgi:peptide/nickel transport system substrate-binding protein
MALPKRRCNMRKRKVSLFQIILYSCFVLLAYSHVSWAEAKGKLVISTAYDLPTMDPHMHSVRPMFVVGLHLFDNLVYREPDTRKIVPHLATSWKMIDDLTWEFKLRQGVKFHNGYPFTARDVKFNFDRVLNPDQKSAQRPKHISIKSAEVIDDYTIRLHTKSPYPVMLERLANFQMISEKYTKEKGDAHVALNPVGTGPYKFVSWRKGRELVVEANENYWKGAPSVKTLVWRTIPETTTQIAELLSGGVDFIESVPPDQIDLINSSGVAKIKEVPVLPVAFIKLDGAARGGANPFQDKRVRQAINYAANIDGYIKHIMKGRAIRVATWASPFAFGYDPSIKPYPYDPEKAKKLLAEAGYPNGFEVRHVNSHQRIPGQRQFIEALQADLAKVGIRIKIQEYTDEGPLFTQIREGKAGPMYQMSWGYSGTHDLDAIFYEHCTPQSFWAYWWSDETTRLIEQARNTLDSELRKKIYSKLQHIIKEEAPVLYMWQYVMTYGVGNKITSLPIGSDEIPRLFDAKIK